MTLNKLKSIIRHILHADVCSSDYAQIILDFAETSQRNTLLLHAIDRRLQNEKSIDLEYLKVHLSIAINPITANALIACLEEKPKHPAILPSKLTLKANYNIAIGKYVSAESILALALNAPENWRPFASYAKLCFLQGRFDDLDDCLEKAFDLFPTSLQIALLRMDLLSRLQRFKEAIKVGQEALSRIGDQPRIYSAIASYLTAQGKADESIEYFVYSLSLDPDDAYCLAMLGDAFASLNKPVEAIQHYEKALALRRWSSLFNRIGLQLGILRRPDLAIVALSQGLAIDKNDKELWVNTANAFAVCGEPQVAVEILERLLTQGPISWRLFSQIQFKLSIQGEGALEKLRHYGQVYWSMTCKLHSAAMPKKVLTAKCKPLRVGFLSADVGDHVVGRFLLSILSGKPESFSIDVISTQRRFDAASLTISQKATQAYTTQGLSAQEARTLIKARDYDIIVDTGGYTKHSGIGLLADRCAPIQCHYIGYHASTYAPFIDYFIADEVLIPEESNASFVEEVYRLKRTWLALSTDYLPDSELIRPRVKGSQMITFGTFCQASKISEQALEVWSCVLARVPNSNMLIKSINLTGDLKAKIISTFEQLKISASRVKFIAPTASHTKHLQLYNQIDIALDTSPWSSATTCFEALSMGVPLVAFTGQTLSARMSTSVVNGGGLGGYASSNLEDYASICHSLSEEIQALRITKKSIRKRIEASELFDNVDLARHLGSAFLDMYTKLLAF